MKEILLICLSDPQMKLALVLAIFLCIFACGLILMPPKQGDGAEEHF